MAVYSSLLFTTQSHTGFCVIVNILRSIKHLTINSCTHDLNSIHPLISLPYWCWFTVVGDSVWKNNNAKRTMTTSAHYNIPLIEADEQLEVGAASSSILTVHSQSAIAPSCPPSAAKLWSGYSFGWTSAKGGHSQGQDLGRSGSCLRRFAPLPLTQCQGHPVNGTRCRCAPEKASSFWLAYVF